MSGNVSFVLSEGFLNRVCPAALCFIPGAGKQPCFSGKTLVRILESPQPIPIEDLKTGDHVQCMDTTEDMRLPTTVKYCEVMNWLHARADAVVHFTRIHFNRLGAAPRSLTVSPTHYVLRLTSPGGMEGRTAARVHDCEYA
jgi:hypothetical protein